VGVDTSGDRLLATCWTTAGEAAPYAGQHTSPIPLRTRIEAAQRAGFSAFGLLDFDLRRFLEDSDLATLAALLADNGMDYVELEFLTRWWTTGAERAQSDVNRELLFWAAESLGAHHVKVAPDLDDVAPPDLDFWGEAFHHLAEDAANHGTRVALEFMPFANISTLDQAVAIAQLAGHPAGGLLVDIWHVQRSGLEPEAVAAVPLDVILAVELDDGTAEPVGDPYDDTCLRRLVPGDGDFAVADFAAALLRIGWNLPWGVEIISETFRTRDLDECLPYVARRTREQLAAARSLASHDIP
jgi:sugar phosphate isomerase/epimerase